MVSKAGLLNFLSKMSGNWKMAWKLFDVQIEHCNFVVIYNELPIAVMY